MPRPNDRAAAGDRALAEASALRRLVDLIAHRSGAVPSLMDDAGVTLAQVLLMDRVCRLKSASISELASLSPGSAAAVSQMVDRLVRRGLLARKEDPADRRRKEISICAAGSALLDALQAARTADYALGLSRLAPTLRAELGRCVERAIAEIETSPDRCEPGAREPKGGPS